MCSGTAPPMALFALSHLQNSDFQGSGSSPSCIHPAINRGCNSQGPSDVAAFYTHARTHACAILF